jgi:hypothetical protein
LSYHVGLEALRKEEGVLLGGARAITGGERSGWGGGEMGGTAEG